MKTKIFKAGVAMSLCIAAFASSCSDRIVDDNAPMREQVPLEVSVAGINKTRSIITGTTLPDTCEFSVFFNSKYPSAVKYEKGTCTLQEPIYLDEETEAAPVYAFYPSTTYLTEIQIDTRKQIDYLRGISSDSIDASSPRAKIVFDHILSRITLNLHKDSTINEYYKLGPAYLVGNNVKSHRRAIFNAETNSFVDFYPNERDSIQGEMKDDKYMLYQPEDLITIDFVVIPTETIWGFTIQGLSEEWYSLPLTKYESGKQYIYDCLLHEDDKLYLTITECGIRPWQNTTMPEVEAY